MSSKSRKAQLMLKMMVKQVVEDERIRNKRRKAVVTLKCHNGLKISVISLKSLLKDQNSKSLLLC